MGIHDNFFSDLGGHSLLVIQIVGNLREALGRQVSVVEIFRFPTIHSLADHLSAIEDEQLPLHRAQDVTRVRQQSLKQRRSMRQIRQTTEGE